MKVVIDTNVFVSGIFWAGPPYQILKAWQNKRFTLVLTPEILDEYTRVASILHKKYSSINLTPFLELLTIHSELHADVKLPEPVSRDPDDDKFIAAAIASHTEVIVSGDQYLLLVAGFGNIAVLKPKQFVGQFLCT